MASAAARSALRARSSAFSTPLLRRTAHRRYASSEAYEHLRVSNPKAGVQLITLHRPKALNAMNSAFMAEINAALDAFDADPALGAAVLTGSEKAFVAGADIAEMAGKSFAEAYGGDFIAPWSRQTALAKPLLAAVNGYALGGGCELALMADILYCSEAATFGQPEVKLGIIPGAGGSQRLARAVGKSRAMELCLTGRTFSGREAAAWGVAARALATPQACVDAAVDAAATIAGHSRIAVKACKEVVNKSQELGVRDGVEYERRVFHGLFGSADQKIGMKAFLEKREPEWEHR